MGWAPAAPAAEVTKGRSRAFTAGRLLFQSEGAEIFCRRIELHPRPR